MFLVKRNRSAHLKVPRQSKTFSESHGCFFRVFFGTLRLTRGFSIIILEHFLLLRAFKSTPTWAVPWLLQIGRTEFLEKQRNFVGISSEKLEKSDVFRAELNAIEFEVLDFSTDCIRFSIARMIPIPPFRYFWYVHGALILPFPHRFCYIGEGMEQFGKYFSSQSRQLVTSGDYVILVAIT